MRFPTISASLAFATALGIAAPAMSQPRPAQDMLVRLTGADTIGEKGAVELATGWAKQLKFKSFRVDPGADPFEYDVVAEGAEGTQRLRVQVRMKGGTDAGIEPLLRGQSDFWMAARPVRESDLEAMRKKGVPNVPTLAQMQQVGTENVIGLSALAILVNPKNAMTGITAGQMKDMYSGRINNWSQIPGGANVPVSLYSLIVGHGETDTFCGTIVGLPDPKRCLESFARLAAPPIQEPEDMADAVVSNPGGIGFVDLNLKRGARAAPVASGCGVGVEPTVFRIKAEEYPLVQRLILYTAPNRTPSPAARAFLQFTLGPAGQAAIASAELADLAPSVSDPDYGAMRQDSIRDAMDGGRTRIRPTDVRAFQTATANADRLSITYRFQTGTNSLDSKAEADIGRVAALMQQAPYNQMDLLLIGYSASAGDYNDNRSLSQERADAVRDRLLAAGVKGVSAIGIGPAGAVTCNLDPTTSPQNQRVEVWVRKRNG